MAKKINRKMLLADMNAGMDKNALMAKYDLSAAQFESAMRKLSEPTSLSGRQVPKPADAETRLQNPSRCPACAAPLSGALTECPRCGIIFAKYHMGEETPKEDANKVQLPDLLKGEAVKVDERSIAVWIGALVGLAVVITVVFIFFRPWSQLSQSTPGESKAVGTRGPSEPKPVVDTDLEAPDTTEETRPEVTTGSPAGSQMGRGSEVTPPEEATSQSAIAIPPTESTLAEDEAAATTPEKRSEQSNVDMEKTLDSLGQSMIQDFDRAVGQWTSDDFKRFVDRARQTLDEVSAEGLSDAIRQTGENLILQLQMESPETAAEAFRKLVALIRPELNGLSRESKAKFIKATQEIKRDIETSITR